jgi:hypothetical protein
MRLKEELRLYPERVRKKLELYPENYCALIIASQAEVTPEEAFLSLYRKRVYQFIRHKKYTIGNIYNMLYLRLRKKRTLNDIAKIYGLTPKMVWQIINVYGQAGRKMSKCKACGRTIMWILTESGKSMPVEPQEVPIIPDGMSRTIGITPDGRCVRGKLTMRGTPGEVLVRISHFSTCTKADQFRKARK